MISKRHMADFSFVYCDPGYTLVHTDTTLDYVDFEELYRTMLQQHQDVMVMEGNDRAPDVLWMIDLLRQTLDENILSMNVPVSEILKIFIDAGYLVMRPYEGQKELIIGCGNGSCINSGGYPIDDQGLRAEHTITHAHENAYTIDPCCMTNPSCMSFFGYHSYKHILPDGCFDKIILEGVWNIETDLFFSEIKRLASPSAKLFVTNEPIDLSLEIVDLKTAVATGYENEMSGLYNFYLHDYLIRSPFDYVSDDELSFSDSE